jgi:predicted transcriptional regulator
MAAGTAKQKAIEAVERLPADATLADVMERLHFLYKVERGLVQTDAGEIVPHEQARAERERWRTSHRSTRLLTAEMLR